MMNNAKPSKRIKVLLALSSGVDEREERVSSNETVGMDARPKQEGIGVFQQDDLRMPQQESNGIFEQDSHRVTQQNVIEGQETGARTLILQALDIYIMSALAEPFA